MAGINIEDEALQWVAATDRDSRLDFIKRAIHACRNHDELKAVKFILVNSQKRMIRKFGSSNTKGNINASKKDHQREDKSLSPASPQPSTSTEVALQSASAALQSASVGEGCWFSKYKEDDIVGFDTERVELFQKTKEGKPVHAPGSVAVVTKSGKTLLKTFVYHKPGSFKVNQYTRRANGFEYDSLKNGRSFEEVQATLASILEGKLIVVADGEQDFQCFDLSIGLYDTFDVGYCFRKHNGTYTKFGDPVYQRISLRSMYKHFYHEDIQKQAHSAEVDARAALKMFEKYQELYPRIDTMYPDLRDNPFENIITIKD